MRQSKSVKNRDTTCAIYPRLSRDDGVDGDSNSIASQKKLLQKIAKEEGYTNILIMSISADTFLSVRTKARLVKSKVEIFRHQAPPQRDSDREILPVLDNVP